MATSEEYADKIEDLVKAGKYKEANDLISNLIDSGIIIDDYDNSEYQGSPFIDLDWTITLLYAGEPIDDIYWNTQIDDDDVAEIADDICEKEGIPYGRVLDAGIDDGAMVIRLYELNDEGIPTNSNAYNDFAEIEVTGKDVKDLILPAPKDDAKITLGYTTTARCYEVPILFSDGETYYIEAPIVG